ncbi:Condensin complex subunit 2 family protein [Leishmania donovani]|uniref:Condensin complex subunit 2 n=1 Tax=Leishmania donovani TaxID=5661 RepID=A0A504YB35_LEIDO|nr:Condensin complex subunit 2 family protein [Leishmania donovani]
MHTPEPRPRHSRGGNASTTPQVDSSNATPTPRAGFLRRGGDDGGGDTLHGAIAAGPSVLFDEETGTAVAVDGSPQPTQLTQQQQLYPGQARLPRQRPRFHTVQDLDVALNQAIEGKITSRNAWASKEASDLLEGITHTIETTLDNASTDDYAGFAKAATVVEGCSKVWTSRVDSTYQRSNQMVQRLLRKDDTSGKPPTGGRDDGEGGDGEEGEEQQRAKSRSRSVATASAAAAATRTLAMEAAEINLDSKSRTALTQTHVNAQFRAITSKFDQGNAQGLLMNNAPMGRAGNIILDVDYSVMPASDAVDGCSRQGSRRISGPSAPSPSGGSGAEGQETQAETVTPSRVSQHASVELDAAVYETVADLPPYYGVTTVVPLTGQLRSIRGSESFPQARDSAGGVSSAGDARGSQASAIDPLLLLPHVSPPRQDLSDLARVSLKSDPREGYNGSGASGEANRESRSCITSHSDRTAATAGGGDAAMSAYDSQQEQEAEGGARTDSEGADRGAEARRLVSGAAEMELMDNLFHGHTQLALEAEDPTSWCPLSEVSANPLAGVQGLSALSRLHREHRFAQSQKGADGDDAARNRNGGERGSSLSSPVGAQLQPTTKRGRKERTVVFQLPQSPSCGRGAGASGVASATAAFATESRLLLDDSALRQATTAARNITPLGKQLLFARNAAQEVLAYTQSAVQRSKAEQAGLLLPEAPIRGKTIPSYMPFPVHTQDFFQPFSTSLTHWNLLRKSATGHLVDSTAGARNNEGPSSSSVMAGGSSSCCITGDCSSRLGLATRTGEYFSAEALDEDSYGGVGARYGDDNMPVEFFPGGAEVEAQDGGEAGGDYADYAELYGPDDNHSDEEEESRYVQGGFHSSADARLIAEMELAAAAATSVTVSGGSSTRSSGTTTDALLADPLELLKVLSPPEATLPNQVDVVKLRQLMWEALRGRLAANQQEKAVDLATLRCGAAAAVSQIAEEDEDGVASLRENRKVAMVKAHAQAALNALRQRVRSTDAGEDAQSANCNEDTVADHDVVRSVLPHISVVSSTNTLSPAFFFFSILFLANEHNVVLQSVEDLNDLVACGIAGRVGE